MSLNTKIEKIIIDSSHFNFEECKKLMKGVDEYFFDKEHFEVINHRIYLDSIFAMLCSMPVNCVNKQNCSTSPVIEDVRVVRCGKSFMLRVKYNKDLCAKEKKLAKAQS